MDIDYDFFKKTDRRIDLIFAEDPQKLLANVKKHLEKENMQPLSLNIVKEHNNFCALVVGEPKGK